MPVIELAIPGLEATTVELISTLGASAHLVQQFLFNHIISTQLLSDNVGYDDDSSFEESNGPQRFTFYTLVLTAISLCATFVFLPFLPASKEECLDMFAPDAKVA
jgi:hypothetical protein